MKKSGEMESAQGKKRGAKAQLETASAELAEARAARDAAEKLSAELHAKLQDLSERASKMEVRAAELDREFATARAAREAAEQQVTALQAAGRELTARADEAGREARTGADQAKARLDAISWELAEHKAARERAEKGAAALQSRADESGHEAQRARQEAEEAKARGAQVGAMALELTKIRSARDAAEKQAVALQARVLELEKALLEAGDSKDRVAGLERRVLELSSEAACAASLEKELVALGGQLEELKPAKEESARRIDALQRELASSKEAEEKARAQASEVAPLRAALEARTGEAKRLDVESHRELAAAKVESTRRIDALQRELADSKEAEGKARAQASEMGPLRAAVEARGGEIKRLKEESRRELDAAKEESARRIDALQRELADSKKEAEARARAQAAETGPLRAAVEARTGEVKRLEEESRRTLEGNTRRIDALRQELAALKEAEARARTQAAETAPLRAAVESRSGEIKRLEEARKVQEARMEDLRRTVANLERRLQEAAVAPAPADADLSAVGPAKGESVEPPTPPTETVETAMPPVEPTVEPPPPPMMVPAPTPAGSTAIRVRKLNPGEAVLDPRNLFGPVADDGRPAHVLLEQISVDALGVVYRAVERSTGRRFAVRFMSGQAGEEQTAAIEREVERMIALPHPGILHVQGSGRRQNRLFIMMDLVESVSLGRAKIQELPRLCSLLRDAAEAVHYAHEEKILHGDLNPENIIVGREGDQDRVLVKDFGLGHLLEAAAKPPAPSIRPPAYLPPDQMGRPSVSGDVYGLGATLYAVLAGRPPFEGQDAKQVLMRAAIEEPTPLGRLRRDVPEALGAIVRRAMAKERSLRYASAGEMAQALTRFLQGPATGIRPRPPAPDAP